MMRIKAGRQDEYVRRHREVWPEVMAEHRRAGVAKMAIYMNGSDLFLYMEVEDYSAAVRILNKSPAVLRWEAYMAPLMEDSGEHLFSPTTPYPESLPEVFYWESSEGLVGAQQRRVEAGAAMSPSKPHSSPSRESSVKS